MTDQDQGATYSKVFGDEKFHPDKAVVDVLKDHQKYADAMKKYRLAGEETNQFITNIQDELQNLDSTAALAKCKEKLSAFEKEANFAKNVFMGSNADDAIMRGLILVQIKKLHDDNDGLFQTWCDDNLAIGKSQRRKYMTLGKFQQRYVMRHS